MPTTRRKLFQNAGVIVRPGPNLHKRTSAQWIAQAEAKPPYFRSSFWGSAFPAGDALHCGRKMLYSLMNPPSDEKIKPLREATAQAGHDVEKRITTLWHEAGITIADDQLRLQVPEYWVSCALDAVLDLRPEWPGVLPTDVKSKAEDKIKMLKTGALEMDPSHYAQVCSYIFVCRYHHEAMGWDKLGLEPARAGFVYYVSRDNPSNGVAFFIEPDEGEIEEALATLKTWKESFIAGEIPERPKAWRWTEQPCKWCDHKKLCKADVTHKITNLLDSHVVKDGKRVDKEYDAEKVHSKVLKRWEEK